MQSLLVVPAKAGTQYPQDEHIGRVDGYWMPAFAGMTRKSVESGNAE